MFGVEQYFYQSVNLEKTPITDSSHNNAKNDTLVNQNQYNSYFDLADIFCNMCDCLGEMTKCLFICNNANCADCDCGDCGDCDL